MNDLICSLPQYQHFLIVIVVAVFECWLGKTPKLEAGSTLELIYNLVKKLWTKPLPK